jgi:DNA polymerase/3'-5' exonuclease PolX
MSLVVATPLRARRGEGSTVSEVRYPYADALNIANDVVNLLTPSCERIIIAGSLRREKPDVGDIEILFIPKIEIVDSPSDWFDKEAFDVADDKIKDMVKANVFKLRINKKGSYTFGQKNKLVTHVESGIPVDLFSATTENWFNYLVCRTGPAESNIAICNSAIAKGWKWHPYGEGFSNRHNVTVTVPSERAVFDFVGLPYKEPRDR